MDPPGCGELSMASKKKNKTDGWSEDARTWHILFWDHPRFQQNANTESDGECI